MAKGIYMGGEKQKGIAGKQIRKLASAIKAQQDKFVKQAGKAKLWNLGGDFLQSVASLFGPAGMVVGGGLDLLIDQISGSTLMGGTKAGDSEAIKKLETAYTGGGYGEEFGEMVKESRPDLLSGLLQEGVEGVKSFALGEAAGGDYPLGKGSKFQDLIPDIDFSKFKFPKLPLATDQELLQYLPKLPFAKGGQVPKYYGGGSVQSTPTISEYFDMQGKTLGGSNKQSLAEKLGRI